MTPNEQLLKEWAMEGGHLNRTPIIHGIYGPYFAKLQAFLRRDVEYLNIKTPNN